MKKRTLNLMFLCLFAHLTPTLSLAYTGETYFKGDVFRVAKRVQMLGAPSSPQNLMREDHIGMVVERNSKKLRYCYETTLTEGILPRVESAIYFGISVDGQFKDLSIELLNIDASTVTITTFFSCITHQLRTFRAATSESEGIFRLLLTFDSRN